MDESAPKARLKGAIEPDNQATPAPFAQRLAAAHRLWDDRRIGEAKAAYVALLEEKPDSAILHSRLGTAYLQDGALGQAATHLQRAAELEPGLPWPYIGLGEIAAKFGRYEEALEHCNRAETRNASVPWPHATRSEINEALGRYDDAIADLEHAVSLAPQLSALENRLRALRSRRDERMSADRSLRMRSWPAACDREERRGFARRPRISVIAWDLSHNPAGRALILTELAQAHGEAELIGPIFSAFGGDLWPPLRESRLAAPIRAFEAHNFKHLIEGAVRLVAAQPCDIAWVSKPRLPSLLIGFLYKLIHGAKVVLDIDDDELAFVGATAPMTLDELIAGASPTDWREPNSACWTQLAQSMIPWADSISVCNPVLQSLHGGTLVRHARDEAVFDPAQYDRAAVRSQFGLAPDDKVVLFLGTPRPHKGILQVAAALAEIDDPKAVLCVIGTMQDRSFREALERVRSVRTVFHPDQPFSRLPELNAMADIVCTMQDPDSPISKAQTPAKLTDAIAMGIPVIATPVAPIADFIEAGVVVAADAAELAATLKTMLAAGRSDAQVERARSFFRRELSYAANRERAGQALDAASKSVSGVPDGFLRLLRQADAEMPGTLHPAVASQLRGAVPTARRAGALRTLEKDLNVVFFWKQNDSDLYGRRQDMLVRELAGLPRVRRILHIDAPISADRLIAMAGKPSDLSSSQDNLIVSNTIARMLGTRDAAKVHRRSFIYRGAASELLGRELPDRESFPNQVEAWMRELDMMDNVLAWVCPVVPHFPDVAARIGIPFIVADVIDDQRRWPMIPRYRTEIETNYRETFEIADVVVANCGPVADWLAGEGLDPLIVPNGMEIHHDVDSWREPPDSAGYPRPIVAYAGSLTARIDWPLIASLAQARPHWSIVLIGATPRSEAFRSVAALPNVHVLGVVPYERATRLLAAADAAMIPHETGWLTQAMNPLKLYVYRSLGLPVVSTPVGNIDDFRDEVRIAATPEAFVSALDQAIEERRRVGRCYPDPARVGTLTWEARLAAILEEAERVLARRGRTPLAQPA